MSAAIITGASSGIGAAIAKKFAAEKIDLILFGRDESRLKSVAAECRQVKVSTLAFDIKSINQMQTRIEQIIEDHSGVNYLVNNAGIYKIGGVQSPLESWNEQFEVNLFSAVKLTQIVWPFFLRQKKGSVVNISSTLGLKPTANTQAYSASKAAMINWTQSLAQEGGSNNIRANCICPGIVDTPIHSFNKLGAEEKEKVVKKMAEFQLLNFIGTPLDVAEACYFLASEKSHWTTGSVLSVDGGINIK